MSNQAFSRVTIGRVLLNDGEEAQVSFRTEKGVAYTRVYERGGDDLSIEKFHEHFPIGGDRIFCVGPIDRQWGGDTEGWDT